MSEILKVKEYPRAGNLGLEAVENGQRSKFPGCYDKFQVPFGKDKRRATGIDELSYKINSISNPEERELEKNRIKELRENLEKLTGKDLSGTSSYWDDYSVEVIGGMEWDMSNAKHVIDYNIAITEGTVAPSLKDARDGGPSGKYLKSKYYVSRENEDVSSKVEKKRRYNSAVIKFETLMEDYDRAVLVARYLGLHVTNSTPLNNVYDRIQEFLDRDEDFGSVDKFLSVVDKNIEELTLRMIIDDALKFKVISQVKGLYQRGIHTFGKSIPEVISRLGDPELSGELISIKEEIEFKRKFG